MVGDGGAVLFIVQASYRVAARLDVEGGDQSEDQVLKYCFIFENYVRFFGIRCLKIILYFVFCQVQNILTGCQVLWNQVHKYNVRFKPEDRAPDLCPTHGHCHRCWRRGGTFRKESCTVGSSD